MARARLLRLWLALSLVVLFVAAVALWLHGTPPDDGTSSALPMPAATSPVSTPASPSPILPPSPRVTGGTALFWVALGIVLALGVAFSILRWQRRDNGRRTS